MGKTGKTEKSGLLGGILFAQQHAAKWGTWVVIVTPDDSASVAREHLAALAEGSPFSGRTLQAGNGRVSLSTAAQEVFIPDDTSFEVLFLGWGAEDFKEAGKMERWRTASKVELSLEG